MRSLIVLILLALTVPMYAGRDDADRYIREAEYYQKKADGYRREAAYYLRKAEQYERDAAYYTKKGKLILQKATGTRQKGQWIATGLSSDMHQEQMKRRQIT